MSSPSQSNTDIGRVADEFTAAILEHKTVIGQTGILHGDTVYDPLVGSGTTPAVAVRLVPRHPPVAA